MGKKDTFTVHCYVERKNGVWQAFSMEFGLAAQGESCRDAKVRLDQMIHGYLYDAFVGEDQAQQAELLGRRAPVYQRVKYHVAALRQRLAKTWSSLGTSAKVFKERIPDALVKTKVLDIEDAYRYRDAHLEKLLEDRIKGAARHESTLSNT